MNNLDWNHRRSYNRNDQQKTIIALDGGTHHESHRAGVFVLNY